MRVAVLLPCYNEEAAIAQTIAGFREHLPDATIYVFDNNSKDRTIEVAKSAGAVVVSHSMQQIRNLCDAVVVLEAGHLRYYADVEEGIRDHNRNMASGPP